MTQLVDKWDTLNYNKASRCHCGTVKKNYEAPKAKYHKIQW